MRVRHQMSRIRAGIPRGAFGALAVSFLALFVAGCFLISGTLRIEHDFQEGPQRSSAGSVKELFIDLNGNSDFEKNKDKIKSVDEVGFVFEAINHRTDGATGQIWASSTRIIPTSPSPDSLSVDDVTGHGTLVVDGLTLEPGPDVATIISYDESLRYQPNQDYLHDLVKGGTFYLYGIASDDVFDITIQKNTAVVVVTVEL